MVDPVTTSLTAGAIATLAFQEFVKSSSVELSKTFTAKAIAKMQKLRELIRQKLNGNADAESAIDNAINNSHEDDIADIATYLRAAMRRDPQFAAQLQTIAQQIDAGRIVDKSNMVQNNYGNARGWQTKVEGGTAYIGEVHQHNVSNSP